MGSLLLYSGLMILQLSEFLEEYFNKMFTVYHPLGILPIRSQYVLLGNIMMLPYATCIRSLDDLCFLTVFN